MHRVGGRCKGRVTFADVTFAYPTRPERPVLQGLHLVACAEQTTALVGGLSALAYCLPMPRAGKCVALLGLSCLLLANRSGVSFGQVRLQVLDVGQGSAAIIDTRTRRLVVDAGPKSENRFDAGESIVIPALRSSGFDQVDLVMLTHMDNDHAGGRAALERRYPNAEQMFGADACVHN